MMVRYSTAMRIVSLEEIRSILPRLELLPAIEEGFRAYSEGSAVVPPVGELLLDRGEVHIKYGYIRDQDLYVIKIASGFYRNSELGLPSGQGMMLLFNQVSGEPVCLLQDEGHLTDLRTALAGAVCAKYLAPRDISSIGIVGTGVQADLQLRQLEEIIHCRRVLVWGRSSEALETYRRKLSDSPFQISTTLLIEDIQESCQLIVTTTPSQEPLLKATALRPGTHMTAVGSDTHSKQELEAGILEQADLVVADSIEQCQERGEIHHALRTGLLKRAAISELGRIIAGNEAGRTTDEQITVADLTGVAVQDIQIASEVFRALG